MLGIDYPPSFLANPKNHRTRPSLLLTGPEGNVLIDCTPEVRMQLLRESVRSLEAVVITHTHADHIMGMDDLRSFSLLQRKDMTVFTLPQYQEDIRRVFAYAFKEHAAGIEVPRFDLRDCPPVLEVAGFRLETFTVWHGPWPVIAFRVNGLAYLTDVNRIPPEAEPFLKDLDTLILDAVRYKPHPNHFHFDQAVEVALSIKARRTYFTHLSHDYDHDVVQQGLPPGIFLSYDGLRISL